MRKPELVKPNSSKKPKRDIKMLEKQESVISKFEKLPTPTKEDFTPKNVQPEV